MFLVCSVHSILYCIITVILCFWSALFIDILYCIITVILCFWSALFIDIFYCIITVILCFWSALFIDIFYCIITVILCCWSALCLSSILYSIIILVLWYICILILSKNWPCLTGILGSNFGTFLHMASTACPAAILVSQLWLHKYPWTCKQIFPLTEYFI
jgi:hypothetical protein